MARITRMGFWVYGERRLILGLDKVIPANELSDQLGPKKGFPENL
jgi:hypothetical protein